MIPKLGTHTRTAPNGAVLVFGISYAGMGPSEGNDANRGSAEPKIYTYAMIKAGGLWYVTGSGRVPIAAGWGAVERWLERDGRTVEWVETVTDRLRIYPNLSLHAGLSVPCDVCGGPCLIDGPIDTLKP